MNFESPARLNITGRYHRLPKRMTDDYESLPQAGTDRWSDMVVTWWSQAALPVLTCF
jgi:hypothetical protein